ncbi:MAG: c-type cytochrome [Casimicrobiaceae bacterium]
MRRGHLFFGTAGDRRPAHRARRTAALGLLCSTSLLWAAAGGTCAAADVTAGRGKALMCQACHGIDGISKIPDAPNIAGQPEPYLAAQLKAFKSGVRKNDAMSLVAQALSDKDIDDLAAYFSAIEIQVVKIPGQ